jgi:hypothetical protein
MLRLKTNKTFFYLGAGILVSSGIAYLYTLDVFNVQKYFSSKVKNNDTDNNKSSKDDDYINQYYDKFNALESNDIDEEQVKKLKNSSIYEFTPKGSVLMHYDFEKESFVYYCNTKDIPYRFLETVARKYVTVNNCKKIMVDMNKELKDAVETFKYNTNNKTKSVANNTNNISNNNKKEVFTTFKNYNRLGNGGSKSTTLNKKFILPQNANRYSYSGKIKDFSFLNKNGCNDMEPAKKKMDYAAFKKLMNTK